MFSECHFTKGGPLHKANNLLVNLTGERWLHIKWEAIDSSETGKQKFNGTYRGISNEYLQSTYTSGPGPNEALLEGVPMSPV